MFYNYSSHCWKETTRLDEPSVLPLQTFLYSYLSNELLYERIFLEQEMNVEGGENPELLKCRKLVMCFVVHIAKERKLRENFNAERRSNVITCSVTDCIGLQSCLFSFYISLDITVRNRSSLVLWWFLLVVLQVHIEDIFWSCCVSSTSYMLLSKPVAELKFHNLHYSIHILLIKKKPAVALCLRKIFFFFRMGILMWNN